MTDTSSMQERILSAAEKRIRAVGFNAVSFRDLANDVGVKSSSIHYHFPQKEDLGELLVARYSERFQARLDQIDIEKVGTAAAMKAFIALYAEALVVGESVCLCAILGAEANSLPQSVNDGVRRFFEANAKWLRGLHDQMLPSIAGLSPLEIISALEGSMIVSSAMKNSEAFDATAARILTIYTAD